MAIAGSMTSTNLKKCPHCSNRMITWDRNERETYCFICGWRLSFRVTTEEAKIHFEEEKAYWANLFATEKDPDEKTNVKHYA